MPGAPLDLAQLLKRLEPLGVAEVGPLAGGASSLTFLAAASDGSRLVVKVAPPGVAPVHHRDVLRQALVMKRLRSTAVPVPEIVWEDVGDPPDVPPLFVTSFVPGTSLEPLFDGDRPTGEPPDAAEVVAERLANAARALAALHVLDPAAIGLGNEVAIGLREEVGRWCRLLETVDPGVAPGWEDVASALHAIEPGAMAPAVVHGDFRLGNLLSTGPTIAAVIDWEIWSVGDPRIDVGWFLANADPATYGRATSYAGALPAPAELAAIYADAVGHEVPDLHVFQSLACFKSTATWSLIVKHNRRRAEPDPDLEAMAGALPHLLERATQLLH